jgi:hypothetical protein
LKYEDIKKNFEQGIITMTINVVRQKSDEQVTTFLGKEAVQNSAAGIKEGSVIGSSEKRGRSG